jgi:hypothetical protein
LVQSFGQGQEDAMESKRQAIVLIHGIGEQRPMSTLRGFVETVVPLAMNDELAEHKALYHSKPDSLDETFELRRLMADRPTRTDFYEFYWAHLMPDTSWNRVVSWFLLLMWRRPSNVPKRLVLAWTLSWTLAIVLMVLLVLQIVVYLFGLNFEIPLSKWGEWPALLSLALAALAGLVLAYVGDAAIYFGPSPKNIDARSRIRAQGARLLKALNAEERYDRIVVVGHSLGSVIAYDIIALAWQDLLDRWRDRARASAEAGNIYVEDAQALWAAEDEARKEVRQPLVAHTGGWRRLVQSLLVPFRFLTRKLDRVDDQLQENSFELETWQIRARQVREAINKSGHAWKISDLVTLGSPLTYGDFLLADSRGEFGQRLQQRELATAPPTLELTKAGTGFFTYDFKLELPGKGSAKLRVPHHAAQFAATVWSNIYFVNSWLPSADPIGGPLAPLFGRGVRDIPVTTNLNGGFVSHIHYWTRPRRWWQRNDAPARLVEVLDLAREKA